jgi:hypothetical protein
MPTRNEAILSLKNEAIPRGGNEAIGYRKNKANLWLKNEATWWRQNEAIPLPENEATWPRENEAIGRRENEAIPLRGNEATWWRQNEASSPGQHQGDHQRLEPDGEEAPGMIGAASGYPGSPGWSRPFGPPSARTRSIGADFLDFVSPDKISWDESIE